MRYENFIKSFNELGAITQWQFCGVFENLNSSGLDMNMNQNCMRKMINFLMQIATVKLDGTTQKKLCKLGLYFFSNESEYGNGIIYAQTFIQAKKKRLYFKFWS